ncbi:PREDICTED: zinc finger protein 41 homolog, partial [Fulmarus glacialis]
SFSDGSNLMSHQKIHHGERPYRFPNCGKGFTMSLKSIKHQ